MTNSYLPTYFRTAAEGADELLTVAESCAELRVSKWTLYQYIHSRQLASLKIRSRRLIPRSALRALVEKLTIEAAA
ncbi:MULTISPECIES: helix-turn-helix domain-containing protein [unclassified Streptomyces]|uniref:helix-turn-helix domain-containing protein n=1 Tax=unclassified Streptomyces TaxID=2593676 RepID=UPI00081F0D78|nr:MULTISPECIES: helix-turn-helix domain-containing protein [unclassified Streptomyces]MYZ33925.1 helix-turn-helix domain-containing protein [Streptomyces sp. SID4917]SCF62766.1 DNA binding domain-containing protein, excisionase family [Streptomyces sp. MnatMP-M17]